MQTNLADPIRHTPEGQTADEIIRRCVHCGICNAVCPTYRLSGNESPESQTRADKMAELTNTYKIDGTPTVIVGGKYKVEFADWESGMKTIDLLADRVREEQKTAK